MLQRREKDQFFKNHEQSPLTPEQQQRFNHLEYYPFNPALIFEITPEQFGPKANVTMQTSDGQTRHYLRWGKVRFEVDGQPAELTLFLMPGSVDFFVPFMDTTSGSETYSAGRYVEAPRLGNGKVQLNLNHAYNPYCAYTEPESLAVSVGRSPRTWSCPIPPAENRLKVAIRAGEKKPVGNWIEAEHD